MRKEIRFSVFAPALFLVFAAALTGCATVEKSALFGGSPIALVSLAVDKDINWKGEGAINPSLASRSVKRTLENNSDSAIVTDPASFIDEIEWTIRSTLEQSSFITFAPEETVFSARAYNEAKPNANQEKAEAVQPEGYRYVYYRDRDFLSGFAAETGVRKCLFIGLTFSKSMYSGFSKFGNCRAEVSFSVMLKDEQGKTLFYKIYEAIGREQTGVDNGIYSQTEMRSLILSALSDACYYLLDDLAS